MLILGLTGPTGAGKGAVAALLTEHGFAHIDGDVLSRALTERGKPCLAEIAGAFGPDILTDTGALDRKRLGKLVFSDKKDLRRLNAIIHPYIEKEVLTLIREYKDKGFIGAVIDGAALYESGLARLCRAVVCVAALRRARLARIMARDGLTKAEAYERMNAQPGGWHYKRGADFIIKNNKGPDHLRTKVAEFVKKLKKSGGNMSSS